MAPSSVPERILPTYTIDLAIPPHLRYVKLAEDFGERMRSLRCLLDKILDLLFPMAAFRWSMKLLAKTSLRRLYDDEETQEIKGISKTTGVEIYLLVALNSLLDYLLGCTSGAVRARPASGKDSDGKGATNHSVHMRMMHFRTLDWGMDELRDLLVVLEFVDSSSESPDRVIARSITYAGFVGTLTAVRQNMSLSMNFRPNHTCSTYALRRHQLLVLLGRRKSIASVFRSFILDGVSRSQEGYSAGASADAPPKAQTLVDQAKQLASERCAPCYIVLCDGREAAVIEKDLLEGSIRTSTEFLVQTNHDVHRAGSSNPDESAGITLNMNSAPLLGHDEWIYESTHRMDAVVSKWQRHLKMNYPTAAADRSGSPEEDGRLHGEAAVPARDPSITEGTLKRWLRSDPVLNECTHFQCILDPKTGRIRWIESLLNNSPVEEQ
ncbi:hypothetical protein DL766_002699 [Monosporascus sp. MC13-8B]|uniref:ceramidase n=1 Tax=Monosporascus cannonballus TaxID=155416 RepID=A0ABY0H772_9PEZI|nr:hypothetical protein DL762_005705 [Monosporascus cannonballus]RYO89810.1 hypothetical protein DL763_005539 [Monosporascus cannonballus]RYP35037.1 hypothetical protein DL766_002699 [Monosporascus sp. MC13-8B]